MAASDIRREDVLKAVAEFDRLGQAAFLARFDHNPAFQFRLVHDGKFYDSKAIVGVAHGYATGRFWTHDNLSGGTGPGAAVTILENLGFFVDNGALFGIEEVQPDQTHGRRAPHQYVVLLWAFARARDGLPRLVPFNDVRQELAALLAPFALGKTAPDPAMPWAALGNKSRLWEMDRQGLSVVTDSDVKRLNLEGGLNAGAYKTAQTTPGFLEAGAGVVARSIGAEPAFRELLAQLGISGVVGPQGSGEVEDVVAAVDEVANPRRKSGRRLSAAENTAIELHAVRVVCEHLEQRLGYETQDVGATESYDIHATRGGAVLKVEVKGTTSDGSEIVLTANEVKLHLADYPKTALAVVRRIVLDRSGDVPVASGGELDFRTPWELRRDWLDPIAYRYRTDG